jgi:hypothetical protein
MSKKEQAALLAFFNSFGLTRRITAFEQLNDGEALLEVSYRLNVFLWLTLRS